MKFGRWTLSKYLSRLSQYLTYRPEGFTLGDGGRSDRGPLLPFRPAPATAVFVSFPSGVVRIQRRGAGAASHPVGPLPSRPASPSPRARAVQPCRPGRAPAGPDRDP